MSIPQYAAIALAVIVYLIFDTYPQVRSISAIFRTPSFYLFAGVFVVLNLIAYAGLNLAAGEKISKLVGTGAPAFLLLLVVSTLGTIGFLQSVTIKLAGYRFVDIEKLVEGFRSRVLDDAGRIATTRNRQQIMALAVRLRQRYQNDSNGLRAAYVQVMTFGGRTPEDIRKELDSFKEQAEKVGVAVEDLIVNRIAVADPDAAAQLCRPYKPSSA